MAQVWLSSLRTSTPVTTVKVMKGVDVGSYTSTAATSTTHTTTSSCDGGSHADDDAGGTSTTNNDQQSSCRRQCCGGDDDDDDAFGSFGDVICGDGWIAYCANVDLFCGETLRALEKRVRRTHDELHQSVTARWRKLLQQQQQDDDDHFLTQLKKPLTPGYTITPNVPAESTYLEPWRRQQTVCYTIVQPHRHFRPWVRRTGSCLALHHDRYVARRSATDTCTTVPAPVNDNVAEGFSAPFDDDDQSSGSTWGYFVDVNDDEDYYNIRGSANQRFSSTSSKHKNYRSFMKKEIEASTSELTTVSTQHVS